MNVLFMEKDVSRKFDSQMARMKDFKDCFRDYYIKYGGGEKSVTLKEIVGMTAHSRAPQYYLKWGYARYRVGQLIKEWERRGIIEMGVDPYSRMRMMEELARRTMATMGIVGNITTGEALARVMAEGDASSFFISEDYAVKLWRRIKRGQKEHSQKTKTKKQNKEVGGNEDKGTKIKEQEIWRDRPNRVNREWQ